MSQLLTLSPETDGEDSNVLPVIWANIKEVFGFLAQHPQLMGIGLLVLGWFVKRTRTTMTVYVPTGRQGPPDPRYQPGTDPYLFTPAQVEVQGLDFLIWEAGVDVADPRAPLAKLLNSFLSQYIGAGPLKDFLLRPSGLGSVDVSGNQWFGLKVTLGDLLTVAGMGALLSPYAGSALEALKGLLPH